MSPRSEVVNLESAGWRAGIPAGSPPPHPGLTGGAVAWVRNHPVVAGTVLGVAWGVMMRAWMRFIALSPEFTWEGTIFILAASAIVGALLGLARWRRSAGGIGWWRFNVLALGLLGAGGAVMWPSVILGGVALGIRRWLVLRAGLVLAASALQVPVLQGVIDENWRMSGLEAAVAVGWYIPMIAVEAWAFSVVFAPAVAAAPAPGVLRRVAFALPLLLMAAGSALVIGAGG